MAVIATENFDSYSNGAGLSSLNGGSGWTTSWSDPGASGTITNTQSVSNPNSVSFNSNSSFFIDRTLPSVPPSGLPFTLSFQIRINSITSGTLKIFTAGGVRIDFEPSGVIKVFFNNVYNTISYSWVTNTWFDVIIAGFSDPTSQIQYAVGNYNSGLQNTGASIGSLQTFRIYSSVNGMLYFMDSILETDTFDILTPSSKNAVLAFGGV